MSKIFTPENAKHLSIPLMNLKGNDYMKVAHRLLWFVNVEKKYTIETSFPTLTDQKAVATVKVTVFDEAGNITRSVTGTKCETLKDFNDFAEKAETGALGRALASLGYGTAQAIADLEEGSRIVDAALETVKAMPEVKADPETKRMHDQAFAPTATPQRDILGPRPTSTFNKNKKAAQTATSAPVAANDDWS